ncbi:MAG: hypothetical protein ACXWNQ_08880, partial [Anaerolineales bacterium]
VYVIGAEYDQYPDGSTIRPWLLTSAVSDVRAGVTDLVRRATHGKFTPGNHMGLVKLAPFHELDHLVSTDIRKRLAELQHGLQTGSIPLKIPYVSSDKP